MRNKKPLDLEEHNQRFGWHGNLCYGKVKSKKFFFKKTQFIRCALLKI